MSDTLNYQGIKPSFDMGRVMNRSFGGLFKNIKPIMLAIVITLIISSIVSIPVYFQDLSDPEAVIQTPTYWVTTALSSVLGFFFMMFMCVFTDHIAFASFTNRAFDFRDTFLRSLKLTLPILFIVILYFISSYIGMIFLIVPGVIISVGWAIIGPCYIHEETSLFGSFGRSWYLTSGYKWWVWLATIVMSLIGTVIFFIAIAIFAALAMPSITNPEMVLGFTVKQFVTGLLFSVVTYLGLALYASFITALYTELRELKEGPLGEEMSAIFD